MRQADRQRRQSLHTRNASRRGGEVSAFIHRRLPPATRTSRGRLHRHEPGSEPRILVVEHDMVTRETLALTLRHYGYDVTVVDDGTEAWVRLASLAPDLVVMNWRMPGLSGLSLCLALRRWWAMLPIVVVTSTDEVFDGEQPVNAWLERPIDPPLLNRVIRDELAPLRSA